MYVVMLSATIVGLWVILEIGRKLSAPEDLSGKWQLSAGPATQPSTVTIEQSGHFFQASLDDGPKVSLRLVEQVEKQIGDEKQVRVTLAGDTWAMDFEGPVNSDNRLLVLNRPRPETSGQWSAKRTIRTFPMDQHLGHGATK